MDVDELELLLAELRTFKTDHQTVEAKRARDRLPASTHETLSAFANSGGGTIVLGVDERDGTFVVSGVADAKQSQSDLQALCAQMTPPLRATIELVDHSDGHVVVARVPAVPREQRPCHLASESAERSSFIRVGDGDQQMSADEVRYMAAGASRIDYSAGAAPDGTALGLKAANDLLAALRAASARDAGADQVLLRRWHIVDDSDKPTFAGALTVGESPQDTCPAARVTYRVHPRSTDPIGTRYTGRHIEGTIGELLDDLTIQLRKDLDPVQVVRDGSVFDALPIPAEALREVLSNALVHRSFAPGLVDRPVLVEVGDDAVAVTSPGNLALSADPELLGLAPVSGVRNYALVRIGELLRTPSGARIVENQTSGIEAADRACRAEGTMPALFVDRPDSFQVLLARGVVDLRRARDASSGFSLPRPEDSARLLAVATRLGELRDAFPELAAIPFDAVLAARSLAPCTLEAAAVRLDELEHAGLLRRLAARRRPVWVLPAPADRGQPTPSSGSARGARRGPFHPDRVLDLLAAIHAAPGAELGARGIGEALGVTSPDTRNKWIGRARDRGLIEATKTSPFDPTGGYRLTAQGRRALNGSQRRPEGR